MSLFALSSLKTNVVSIFCACWISLLLYGCSLSTLKPSDLSNLPPITLNLNSNDESFRLILKQTLESYGIGLNLKSSDDGIIVNVHGPEFDKNLIYISPEHNRFTYLLAMQVQLQYLDARNQPLSSMVRLKVQNPLTSSTAQLSAADAKEQHILLQLRQRLSHRILRHMVWQLTRQTLTTQTP